MHVLCTAKRPSRDVHTVLAQGGINAALGTVDPEDSWQAHAADTLKEGYWLNEPDLVETLAREAPGGIEDLLRWGADFAATRTGKSCSASSAPTSTGETVTPVTTPAARCTAPFCVAHRSCASTSTTGYTSLACSYTTGGCSAPTGSTWTRGAG